MTSDADCFFFSFSILYFRKKTLNSVLYSEGIFINQNVKSVVLTGEVQIKWVANLIRFRFPPMYKCMVFFIHLECIRFCFEKLLPGHDTCIK